MTAARCRDFFFEQDGGDDIDDSTPFRKTKFKSGVKLEVPTLELIISLKPQQGPMIFRMPQYCRLIALVPALTQTETAFVTEMI